MESHKINDVSKQSMRNTMKLSIRQYFVLRTSAVLRLECSIDCITGSVSQTQYFPFIFSLSAFLLKKKKIQKNLIK